jgi:glutamate formiminotransferase/formiminotetrahydrofolate cyclodeaminase
MAAFGVALTGMVANLSSHKRGWDEKWAYFSDKAEIAENIRKKLIFAVDADTAAFNRVMEAYSLPKSTEEEKRLRSEAIQMAQKGAVEVPLDVMKTALEAFPLALAMVEEGNPNSVTDAGVGAGALHSGIYGAYLNVLINLNDLKDRELAGSFRTEADRILAESRSWEERIRMAVMKSIDG